MAVRETLELDVSPAEKAVADLAATLERALRDAMSAALDQTFEATIEGDASDVEDKTAAAVENADKTADVEGDASDVEEETSRAVQDADKVANVEGEASDVEAATSAAVANADTEAVITADASDVSAEVESELGSVDTDLNVTVTADLSDAESAVAGLGDAAFGAGSPVDALSGGMLGAGAAGGLMGKGIGKATAGLAAFGPKGIAAAAVIGGVTAAGGFLIGAARENIEVTETWERTLGSLGDQILNLEGGVTGFDTDLRTLAQTVGSSDEAVMVSTQRLAEWQRSLGASDQQITDTTQQMAALAAQIRVNNPQLGSMDQIIQALSMGLSRGGPRLRAYGLAIDSAAIAQRSFEQTGRPLGSQLSDNEKFTAGLSLAMEQLGPNFEDVTDKAEGTAITMDRAKEKFGDALEELGKPLVSPVTQVMEMLAGLFESLAVSIAPLFESMMKRVNIVLRVLSAQLQIAGRVLGIVFAAVSKLVQALDWVVERVVGAAQAFAEFGKGLLDSIPVVGSVIRGISGFVGGLLGFEDAADDTTEAVNDLDVSVDDLGETLEDTVEIVDVLTLRTQAAADGMRDFASAATGNVPSVTAAFNELSAEKGTNQILAELDAAFAGTQQWTDRMAEQLEVGNANIVRLMGELGPEKSRILLDSYDGELEDLERHLERLAFAEMMARAAAREMAVRHYLDVKGIVGQAQDDIVAEVGERLVLEDPTVEAIEAAARAVEVDTSIPTAVVQAAREATLEWAKALKLDNPTENQLSVIASMMENADVITASAEMANLAVRRYNATLPEMEQFTEETIEEMVAILARGDLPSAAATAGEGVTTGFEQASAPVARAAQQATQDAQQAIRREVPSFISVGQRLATEFATGITLRRPAVRRAGGEIGDAAVSGLRTAAPASTFFTIGQETAAGFANGIRDRARQSADEAARMVREAAEAARREAQNSSPSRLFAAIGDDIGAGLALGMERQTGAVADAAREMLAAAEQASDPSFVAGGTTLREVSISVPVTVTGGVTADEGREFGEQVAGEVGRQLASTLRLEGLVA